LFVTTDQIILILNYLFVQLDLDALSFYVYDAGFVIATSIARRPSTGKADRGQSLLFHEFIQSWIGYELVKVLVTFGLQPITLSSTLSKWSPDLHTIFTYMLTKNPKMKGRAEEILELLFSKTLHCGYWSRVQFGTRTKFFEQSNGVLSLVVLTWLRQLQEFFFDVENTPNNGNWNKYGKYTAVSTNPYKTTTPLVNINFSTAEKPNVIVQITNVNQFKPDKDMPGVCTSLEEWAFCILKPKHQVQLSELVDNDTESEERFSKANDENEQKMFEFNARDLTTNTNENETENNNLGEFNTQTSKNNDLSPCELACRVNMLINENLSKAENRLKNAKKKLGSKSKKK